MVFKRRDRRPVLQIMGRLLYPAGGWARAFEYVKHRVRRLPDTPDRISRGIWAGVFASFTPFYGLHFVVAAVGALLMRGNILASLSATFFGNPLTYVPIAVAALSTGHFVMGSRPMDAIEQSIGTSFYGAAADLWHNFKALFTAQKADWDQLAVFYDQVFLPYLVGGIISGAITATVCYLIARPVIAAYQNSRRKKLRAKLDQLKKKQPNGSDGDH